MQNRIKFATVYRWR